MANKIGIVLALDGEKEFANGMKSAAQSAKLFDQELKNLDEKYKGSANSIEALTEKQEKLKQKQEAYNRELESAKNGQKNAIDNYKKTGERLEELEKDLDKAKNAMEDMEKAGDTSSKAYRDQAKAVENLEKAVGKQSQEHAKASTNITKWDTAIAKAKGDVDQTNAAVQKNEKYLNEAKTSSDRCAKSIDKMGKEASEAAEEVNKVSVSLGDMVKAKAVDMAGDAVRELGQKAIEAAKYVVDVGSQFEASMSKVEALSGASAEQLDAMSQKAQELGSSTKFSASEVADGFSYMALAGWDANQSIAAIDGIVNLAAASEMDLAEASDMVTDYLSAFGMEASEAGKMADMMAYAQANSNTSTMQLGEAFGNCAANMNAAGQDMKTTTSFLEAFANQGVKGSEAGTKLSAIMRDITAKMKDGKIQIGETAVAVTDADGNFRDLTDIMLDVEEATEGMGTAERSAALSATFTSRSVGGLNMILAEGVGNIAGYEASLESADGAASDMAGTMQNNLQGAITEMNSAAEGLGIALYDKVKGPLTDAVRIATELLGSITDAITPEQTALEKFISDVQASNEAVSESISHAQETIAGGEEKAAEITAYSEQISEIMSACEEFNQITLEDGSTAIVDATGTIVSEGFTPLQTEAKTTDEIIAQFGSAGLSTDQIASDAESAGTDIEGIGTAAEETDGKLSEFGADGLNTTNIEASSATAQEMIGYVEDKLVTTDEKLAAFGEKGFDTSAITDGKTAIVEILNEVGDTVDTVETDISDLGTVEIDTDSISTGTDAIITCFDDSTGAVKSFKGSIDDLAAGEIDLSAITSQFSEVEGSIQRTYHITDEFTKLKIDTMVSSLGTAVEGLAEAWDPLTGELSASKEQLEDWFDTAKQVAMYDALQKAVNELYSAWGSSAVNVAKAQSALSAAQGDIDAFLSKTGLSETELMQATGPLNEEYLSLTSNVTQASAALEDANENYKEADAELQTNCGTLKNLKEVIGDEVDAVEKDTSAKQDNAEATGESADANDEYAESADDAVKAAQALYAAQKEVVEAHREAAQAITDAYEQAKEAAESAFDINPFESWEQNEENGLAKMQESLDSQIEGMTNYSANLQAVAEHVGREITPEFLKYIEDMGTGGAQVLQEMADSFASGDTEKIESIMQSYVDAMDKKSEIASKLAMDEVAMKQGLGEFSSTIEEWDGLDKAVEFVQEAGGQVSEEALNAFEQAEETAKECGVKIPAGLQEGIESGTDDPEAAIQEATDKINAAIEGSAEGMLEAAKQAGIPVSEGIAEGIAEGGDAAVKAYQELLTQISTQQATEANDAGQEVGKNLGEGAAESVTDSQGNMEGAATSLADAGKSAMDGKASEFEEVGKTYASNIVSGMTGASSDVSSAAQGLAAQAVTGASSQNSVFNSVGYNMAAGVAAGIQSGQSSAITAAVNMAVAALNAAKTRLGIASPSKEFAKVIGKQIPAGTAVGIKKGSALAKAAAKDMANDTLKATQSWIKAYRKKNKGTREEERIFWAEMVSVTEAGTKRYAKLLKKAETYAIGTKFGVSRTESKKVKNKETGKTETKQVKKDAQKYYSEILSAAEDYFDVLTSRQDMSLKDEKKYWVNVQKSLRTGTKAYTSVTAKIKELNKQIREEKAKAAEEEAKAAEEAAKAWEEKNSDILQSAEDLYDAQTAVRDMSIKEEITYWNNVIKTLDKGSKAYTTVQKKLKALQEQIGGYDVAADALNKLQIYQDMSEKAIMQYWDLVRVQYAEGTEDRIRADEQYYSAKKSYNEKLESLQKDHASDMLDAEKRYNEKLKDLEEDRLDKIKEANQKYKDALDDRTNAIKDAYGLFDAFESESDSGEALLFNMKAQAEGYQFWRDQLNALKGRGILNEDLITELSEKGPRDSAALYALNSLTDEQLKEYNSAYLRKLDISRQQATEDKEDLKKNLTKELNDIEEEYRRSADKAAKEYQDERNELIENYQKSLSEIGGDISTSATTLATNIKSIAADQTTAIVTALNAAADKIKGAKDAEAATAAAQAAVKAAQEQAAKEKAAQEAAAKAAAQKAAAAAAEKAAKEKATKEAAAQAAAQAAKEKAVQEAAAKAQKEAGAKNARRAKVATVLATGKKRSKSLTKAEESNHHKLWEYIVKKYGRTPTDAMYRSLAAIYGISIKKSEKVTSDHKNKILAKLKADGLRRGAKRAGDTAVWMDEEGLGSEMIISRADNAVLTRLPSRSDAVVPANLTDNLWRWGGISPDRMLADLARQQAAVNAFVREMAGTVNIAQLNQRAATAMPTVVTQGVSSGNDILSQMLSLMAQYLPHIEDQRDTYLDKDRVTKAISDNISQDMALRARRRR